ncbi:PKD domain-containing protein [Geodermatophilus sp. CPCC 206100]|uniref:PKD domain-containing protein n=1 Tax=Geodermatophilus sp. CPCC 206100 TaxID=3020054 RepID=UPI003B00A2ED
MSTSTAPAPKRVLSGLVTVALGAGVFSLLPPAAASADTAPAGQVSAASPTTVSADALPTVQINGVAWSQAVVGNTVYVGGAFSTARPAGAAAGTRETPRANLLAYDIRTGELITSFAPKLNGQVLTVTASPDGERIYVGGDFTEVDGQVRRRVAAFDTASGSLVTTWKPSINSQVRAIAATDDTVYLGGSITAVGGVSRSRLAAVRASDGGLLPWAPVPGVGSTAGNSNGAKGTSDAVLSLVVTGGGDQVVAAGRFDSMNGRKATGVAALDPVTGENRAFAINQLITNQGVNSAVYSLSTDGDVVYGTAYDYYGPGNLEGSFAVAADGGTVIEVNECRGDTYSSYAMNGALYVASHTHDCGNIGGFPEQNPRVHKFASAYSTAATGKVGNSTLANGNFRGKPAGTQLAWFPTMTPGTTTGQGQAGWHVTGNGEYLVYAGEFPRVNGVGQQGLVRYAVPGSAPNRVGPSAEGFTATATSPAPGQVAVSWKATSDQDNATLTYRVEREGAELPVAERVQASTWWNRPAMSATEAGVSGSLRYRVVATDPFGNTVATGWAAVEVAAPTAAQGPRYADAVRADNPQSYWRLGETGTGTTAADAQGRAALTVGSGVKRGVEGATADRDTAYEFNGTAAATLSTGTATAAPNTFTQEAWFQTGSTTGGRIMGFGSAKTGASSTYDRQVYLDARGRVVFGVNVRFLFWNLPTTVTSTASFNDGKWHHVAASMSSKGMALYVDGTLVGSRTDVTSGQAYNGYLRVGSDKGMGGVDTFTGRIDEVAVYGTALTAAQVAGHAAAAGPGQPVNAAPSARFASSTDELTAALDAGASSDADGTVASYAWDLGDGRKATGRTVTHAYAGAGTYVVTLTVTDDRGATAVASRLVTVAPAPPNQAPTAAFTTAANGLTLAVDGTGSADADGTVAASSWDFGDGATATGTTAEHTYAAAGTYAVRLTVTDDDGAPATTEQQVVVTAPVSGDIVAKDTFNRTVQNGLGSADVGGAWTASVGAPRLSVTPGAAELALPGAGNNTAAYLGGVAQTSADVLTSFSLSSMPTGNGTYVYVTGRRVGSGEEYRVRVRVMADGRVGLGLSRLTGGAESFPGGEVVVPGLTYTAGSTLDVRVQVSGTGTTEVAAWAWTQGTAEPTAPQLVRTDTTAALQAEGGLGLAAHRPGGSTAATTVRVTGFRVLAVGAEAVENAVPVAAFTATADGLTVAVDGAASTDADGSVTAHAWDFGDGVPATGRTASHTYAAAGTYPVTLTVTDDSGATSSTTQQVEVTAPPAATVLAGDAFGRTVSGGLGTADAGGAWVASAGAPRLSVTPGVAELALPGAGNNTAAYLDGVAQTATDVRTSFSLSAMPTGNGTYVYVTGRRVGSGEEYRVRVRVMADGRVGLALSRLTGGTESFPGGELVVPGLTYTEGGTLSVRVQTAGSGSTEVRATVWSADAPEPGAAQLVRTDTTAALQAPGSVGLGAHRPGSTTAATAVRVTSFGVTAIG